MRDECSNRRADPQGRYQAGIVCWLKSEAARTGATRIANVVTSLLDKDENGRNLYAITVYEEFDLVLYESVPEDALIDFEPGQRVMHLSTMKTGLAQACYGSKVTVVTDGTVAQPSKCEQWPMRFVHLCIKPTAKPMLRSVLATLVDEDEQ